MKMKKVRHSSTRKIRAKNTKSSTDATSSNVGTAADAAIREKIQKRAYELFEQRGMVYGFDLDDWLQAEREVKTRKGLG